MMVQNQFAGIGWLRQSWARRRGWAILALALLAIMILFAALAWTGAVEMGLSEYQPPVPGAQRAKTLWDWMDLLLVPLVLVMGLALFVWVTDRRECRTADRCDQREREIAADRLHQITLQGYFDRMAELLREPELLAKDLLVRRVARARTLAVLRQLDPYRKGMLLQFVHEAGLLKKEGGVLSLSGADLSNANLRKVNLRESDLGKVNLRDADLERAGLIGVDLYQADLMRTSLVFAELGGANLMGVNATGAYLTGSDLREANLSWSNLLGANLIGTDLSGAILVGAILIRADLSGANLRWANLREANLEGAIVTGEQLAEATSLEGATLPDGTVSE